ncbi:MAG: acetyl-CoA carboxylase biotin carboxyl carrier protein [Kiritimatiellae bacterium]|nr:acetyl-CoA carboxylase biotin carboxyl carrier protein [Kiritimatiellia bacterium]
MDYKDIKKIVELMKENELTEFELQEEEFRIALKRGNGDGNPVVLSSHPGTPVVIPAAASSHHERVASLEEKLANAKEKSDDGLVEIKSPMVGTYYGSSAPDAKPFVSVGQELGVDTVVCIVEAMKVINEIKAEVKGIVRKVLVENATPIEFGQPLFKVEPV